jgi:hypothetical protein
MLRVKTLHKIRGEDVVGRYEIDCMINIMMMVDLSWKALHCYSCDDGNINDLAEECPPQQRPLFPGT